MKQWARKVLVATGLGITPWLAMQAQAMELTPASSSPAAPASAYISQAGSGAPDALAMVLWVPLLLIVLLCVGTLLVMIWRQGVDERRQRRAAPQLQPAAQGQAAKLPAALALSSATVLVAPSLGDWPRDWPQATPRPSASSEVQRDAADAGPVLASAENR